jgi:hypothetical protein
MTLLISKIPAAPRMSTRRIYGVSLAGLGCRLQAPHCHLGKLISFESRP